ncbi:type VI secretion system-associated protein TagF [Microbulbifer hydrolyticus]|uniref:Type VI secretion system protein ImpM n=1 Tax=Microbulbifer hydrolyticus TaxID=48074 RepID=A0A6P1T8H5_9GAMM|nr:type VI secretion system-associated protein TagF [Microbulbifer hydrolyticus]MBB5211399.1 type VI secretion system protein ImpM [Microbulbifer hydrolyticus]QHQ37846.1 type VI secretion system-associated protein TagF [Microbulbifer hydrolyticus]
MNMTVCGIYGKLPAHGDFVQRSLPGSFVSIWDAWLQQAVYGAQEALGSSWLDYYMTSPIWRFAFSPGVIDAHLWSGILVPSVDSVGRYFPLTLVASRPANENPFSIMNDDEAWYQALSDLAIEALQRNLMVDDVLEKFPAFGGPSPVVTCNADCSEMITLEGGISPAHSYPGLLKVLAQNEMSSFSLWWCAGSPQLMPTTMLCPGLVDPDKYRSMLGAQKYTQ